MARVLRLDIAITESEAIDIIDALTIAMETIGEDPETKAERRMFENAGRLINTLENLTKPPSDHN
jgi:hypothetical protein